MSRRGFVYACRPRHRSPDELQRPTHLRHQQQHHVCIQRPRRRPPTCRSHPRSQSPQDTLHRSLGHQPDRPTHLSRHRYGLSENNPTSLNSKSRGAACVFWGGGIVNALGCTCISPAHPGYLRCHHHSHPAEPSLHHH